MNARDVYSTTDGAGLSSSVDSGLNITPQSRVTSSVFDPQLSVTSLSSSASTLIADPVQTAPANSWTVMVYIASDNLESYGIQDFLEMAAIGSQNGVNILVQFDRADASSFSNPAYDNTAYGNWTDTRRGIVQAGNTPDTNWGFSLGEVNTGDAASLSDFLNWGISNYQAQNYGLILWGHGNGFGTSMDESGDLLYGNEIGGALAGLAVDLAFLSADSCLMSTVEFAYELSKDVSVFVGSQELVSGDGFNYTALFSGLTSNPHWRATEFGSYLISSYRDYYSQVNTSFAETISMIDLSAIGGLVSAIDQFTTTLMSNAGWYDLYVLDYFRDYYSNKFGAGDYPSYVDIGDVFSAFVAKAIEQAPWLNATIANAAQAVLNAYDAAVIENYSQEPGRSTGLSIYFSNKGYYPASTYNGTNLTFAANTQWDEFLSWSQW